MRQCICVLHSKLWKRELKKGLKIELEQTDDVGIAKEIVKEYYLKDPQYYTKLNKIKSRRTK